MAFARSAGNGIKGKQRRLLHVPGQHAHCSEILATGITVNNEPIFPINAGRHNKPCTATPSVTESKRFYGTGRVAARKTLGWLGGGEYPGPRILLFFSTVVASSAGRFSFLTGSVDTRRDGDKNWLAALSILLPDARTTRRAASLHVRQYVRHVTPSNKE